MGAGRREEREEEEGGRRREEFRAAGQGSERHIFDKGREAVLLR